MDDHELKGATIQDRYLWHITLEGSAKKYGDPIPQHILDRLDEEMDIITNNKFTDYILMIWDIHDFCRTPSRVREFCAMKGITPPPDGIVPLGPGRGSVGGSMVCYCIGIHECDPIKFGLYFERFLNPERIAYPDIDFDISQRYRHIVLAYIAWRNGEDHVAQIITYSTLSANTAVNDVLRCANAPETAIRAVKDTIPGEDVRLADLEKNDKFMKALQAVPFPHTKFKVTTANVNTILKNASDRIIDQDGNMMKLLTGQIMECEVIIRSTWDWEKALRIMKRLEKLNKHESVHAGGVVVAPVVLDNNVPLMRKDGDGVLACQYDMRSLEELGYLKMDALGLRTVDVNHDAEAMVRKWYDKEYNIRKIPYDDPGTIDLIRRGDTVGIFQIESSGFTQMMIDILNTNSMNRQQKQLANQVEGMTDLSIDDFMWISAGIAMYRPGPLDAVIEGKTMVQHIIDRKAGTEPTIYLFPEEEAYLSDTYGVMVYQEQVMRRVRQMTGCTMGRADTLRKAMGKKDPVLMKQQMDWFEETALSHQFTQKELTDTQKKNIVSRARDETTKFARYGFNKAHTVEYAHICYRNAYLKANYPVAFYTALLNSEVGDSKRQAVIIRDMMKHGIRLLPPLMNKSGRDFTMTDRETIRFGLAAIKGLGDKGLVAIENDKVVHGPYLSLEDFRARVPATLCNVTAITSLAKCGAFDDVLAGSIHPMKNRASLVASCKNICDAVAKVAQKKGKNTPKPTTEDVMRRVRMGTIAYQPVDAIEDPIEYAQWEKETLNYFISAHPLDAYRDEIDRWTAIGDVEPEDIPDEFYIAGYVTAVHETVIKKEGRNKGKAMGFVTVETEFRAFEATLFPGIYESCLPYIKVGEPAVLKGKKDFYKDKTSIQGLYMRHLVNSGIRDCPECHIQLDDVNPLDLIQLRAMFDEHPGLTTVFMHIVSGYYDITIKCGRTIALNDRIIQYCDQIGRLTYKPI